MVHWSLWVNDNRIAHGGSPDYQAAIDDGIGAMALHEADIIRLGGTPGEIDGIAKRLGRSTATRGER